MRTSVTRRHRRGSPCLRRRGVVETIAPVAAIVEIIIIASCPVSAIVEAVGRQIWTFPVFIAARASLPVAVGLPLPGVPPVRLLLRLRSTVQLISATGVALSGPFPSSWSFVARRKSRPDLVAVHRI
ncbi:hypothetical protein GUJ93_ZPchr0002g26783 [Zizania palustris]|uniref:Uncharacterized protein n=1 Tax=Zizania palustris TaxID=103762 RepID=A0A8J5VUG0_ZIZPA|nr:hypothetical protein GUJ93_ZPchr0002g26783 [Zizania palustris]